MPNPLTLPARLDSSAAPGLLADLLARRGADLVIDAAQVDMIGALSFEVMIAAGRQWQADGQPLDIVTPSDSYLATAAVLGLSPLRPWEPAMVEKGQVTA